MADNRGNALSVYQNSDNSLHRLTSNTFDYDPRYTEFTIASESFILQDGIFGIAVSPVTNNLYYSPLSSRSLVEDIYNTQLSAKAVSKNGVVFFGLVNNSALGCLNEHQPIQRQNIDMVAQNEETLQMIFSIKIKQDFPQSNRINKTKRNEYMLALSNRLQKFMNHIL
ncbi:major royal jelly protein 2-like [Apis laboriosa]|uniref:major royal jelly protein 2-like n=1 Tax=Apis laboriosa TaxID=183418 RepID=UPI001CC7143E|nr:major royal jelly protein 2-like [Apis laboriosa]